MSHAFRGLEGGGGGGGFRRNRRAGDESGGGGSSSLCSLAMLAMGVGAAVGLFVLLGTSMAGSASSSSAAPGGGAGPMEAGGELTHSKSDWATPLTVVSLTCSLMLQQTPLSLDLGRHDRPCPRGHDVLGKGAGAFAGAAAQQEAAAARA